MPIVRLTGGLADTITDGVNGFTFFDFDANFFLDTVKRAIDVYCNHPDKWKQMMIAAMGQDFSWEKSAEKYLSVYSKNKMKIKAALNLFDKFRTLRYS